MPNQVAVFDPSQMPAHVAAYLNDKSNHTIVDKSGVPSLGYTSGKGWIISLGGEKTKLEKPNADGDMVNIPSLKVIILNYAHERGRTYYAKGYDKDNVAPPLCWSDDGKVPHPSIDEPQATRCDGCPMSKKGSLVTDKNSATTACKPHLMLAVIPANKLDVLPPLRLKLAITSIWDKDDTVNKAQDRFAFEQYLKHLTARGIKSTGTVITKLSFDSTEEYPKILFQTVGWTSPEQLELVAPLVEAEETLKLLAGTWTPAGVDGQPIEGKAKPKTAMPADDEDKAGPTPAAAKAKAEAEVVDDDNEVIPPSKASPKADAAKVVTTPVMDVATQNPKRAKAAQAALAAKEAARIAIEAAEKAAKEAEADDEDVVVATPPKATAAASPKAANGATPVKAKATVVDDDDEPPIKNGAGKRPPAPADTPVMNTAVPKGVVDLLTDWDEE